MSPKGTRRRTKKSTRSVRRPRAGVASNAAEAVADAIRNRGVIYAEIDRVLTAEVGPERSAELLRRAIYDRGARKAEEAPPAARRGDLAGVAAMVRASDEKSLSAFRQKVVEVSKGRVHWTIGRCPLVEAWRALGLPPAAVDRLCSIAHVVDHGKYHALGMDFDVTNRIAAGADHCDMFASARVAPPTPEEVGDRRASGGGSGP